MASIQAEQNKSIGHIPQAITIALNEGDMK